MSKTMNLDSIPFKCYEETLISLIHAVSDAGGSFNLKYLDAPLRDWLFTVAGPNNIRFVYKPSKE